MKIVTMLGWFSDDAVLAAGEKARLSRRIESMAAGKKLLATPAQPRILAEEHLSHASAAQSGADSMVAGESAKRHEPRVVFISRSCKSFVELVGYAHLEGPPVKAILYERYGPPDVLRLTELAKPTPKDNEVLIKTRATTVTSGDWRVRSLEVPVGFGLLSRFALGIFGPRQQILGTELAGQVESTGKNVTKFKVGDEVFAFPGVRMGCYVEYKCMPEDGPVAAKPVNLTFDEAAAISFGGTTALDFFRRGKLERGEKVLVNGASGAVGTAAVQLARHFGAEVTGVCSSANVELVRSLGASRVIDYTKEDFTENTQTYDVIVDTAGTAPFSRSKNSLKEGGRLLMVLGRLSDMLTIPWVSMTGSKTIVAGTAAGRAEDLRYLADLAASGEFRPVIDRRYPFERMVEAHRYVDTGRKRGNVVVTLG